MAALKQKNIFINRELSWLEFNRRVLDLSSEKSVPLGEQLNFAAIYASNLDEFFMIRVGSLYDQTLLKNEQKENKTGLTAKQQLAEIMPVVESLQRQCDKSLARLFKKLAGYSLAKVNFAALTKEDEIFWKKYFLREIFPVLSPQIIDKRHPFPFLRNQEIYVGAMLTIGKNVKPVFGLLPISGQHERVITYSNGGVTYFALVEELVLHFAHLAFGKAALLEKCLFRVTRNADINVEEGMFDHDIDYRVIMGELLKKRRKLAAVRLQFHEVAPERVRAYLLGKLLLPAEQSGAQTAPLELSFLYRLTARLKNQGLPQLFYLAAKPIQAPHTFHLYNVAQKKDVMVYYPYQSIRPFIQMLNDAADDPDVVSIKMTLYRVASDSKIIDALITAAENGKEVVTIVELRARFDEQNNIDWSRQLEQAGCTVIYGFTDYKVHSKITLITRKTKDGFDYISQIGTGNYNEKTSELYTDLSYVTSNSEIAEEVARIFNDMAVEKLTEEADKTIVAPLRFKTVLLQEIEREIVYQNQGGVAQVYIKCNSISDKQIIETLSKASKAGVAVRMMVRGICCLRAGLPGLTHNITVRSMVGRYLEHARIYAFGSGQRLRIYIASGDFLTRNTERRVEVGVRVEDPESVKVLCDILDMQWEDNVNARQMQPDGSYTKLPCPKGVPEYDSQMQMYPYFERILPKLELEAQAAVNRAQRPAAAQAQPPATVALPKQCLLARLRRWLRRG